MPYEAFRTPLRRRKDRSCLRGHSLPHFASTYYYLMEASTSTTSDLEVQAIDISYLALTRHIFHWSLRVGMIDRYTYMYAYGA